MIFPKGIGGTTLLGAVNGAGGSADEPKTDAANGVVVIPNDGKEIEHAFSVDSLAADGETIDYEVFGCTPIRRINGDTVTIEWVQTLLHTGTFTIGPATSAAGGYRHAETVSSTADYTRDSSFKTIGGGADGRMEAVLDACGFPRTLWRFAPPNGGDDEEIRFYWRRLT